MPSFKDMLSKVGNTVKKTADNIAEKSSDLVEISKLNKAIREEEDKISEAITAIGNNVYQSYVNGTEVVDLKSSCDSITEMYNKVDTLKREVERIKTESKNKNSQDLN